MIFKDYLPGDMEEMLNLDVFGEEILIDGVNLKAVREYSTNAKSGNRNLNYPGLHGDFVEIFFRVSDYIESRQRLMRHGEICYLDNRRYTVEEITDEQGMAHLKLSAYRQNTVRVDTANINAAKLGLI